MNLRPILKTAEKFVTDNTPGILTALGVAGTVTTAILAVRAGYSSALKIHAEDALDTMTDRQKIELVWKEFIPTAVMGVVTITSIIAANRVGARRAAAIAAAFKISEELSEEYKRRVEEALGKQKAEKVRSELAAERMGRTPGADQVIIVGSEVLVLDEMSGRFFNAEIEKIRKAVNDINFQINNNFYASLSDFYDLLGLPHTQFSDEVGWNTNELLEVTYTGTLYQDKPAIAISYNHNPIQGYERCM
jgi:hypothetical protein